MARKGNFTPKLIDHPRVKDFNINWAKLCFYSTYKPNLLICLDQEGNISLVPWTLYYPAQFDREEVASEWRWGRGGGNQWTIEKGNIDPVRDVELLKANMGSLKNYVTSYEWCCRSQLIDLVSLGFQPLLMDEIQPTIEIMEWFRGRNDCGFEFRLRVELLNSDKAVITTFSSFRTIEQWQADAVGWVRVEHKFSQYGKGVRFIKFKDGGKDTLWWLGHYGSKMAGASVKIVF